MTNQEAIKSFEKSNEQAKARLKVEKMRMDMNEIKELEFYIERDEMAIKALEPEPCGDAISRQAVLEQINCWIGSGEYKYTNATHYLTERVKHISPVNPQEPKIGHCKDCKWWKDSDGAFRRGIGAESGCPINREEVYEEKGYCFLYGPQERSEKE